MAAVARMHKIPLVRRRADAPYVAGQGRGMGSVMRRVAIALLVLAWLPRAEAQQTSLFTLGSGSVSGGYYEAARAICNAFNRHATADTRCSPEPTAGSLYNLVMLRDGQLDFAFAQSDWQGAAVNGTGPFAKAGAMTDLRSVMSLYPEMITVLARRDAGIETFGDLIGKRVDIGQPGSGRNASLARILDMLELGPADFGELSELPAESAISELCAGRIDATILIVGHPNATVGRALGTCDVDLVPFAGQKVERDPGGGARVPPVRHPRRCLPAGRLRHPDLCRDRHGRDARRCRSGDRPQARRGDLVGSARDRRARPGAARTDAGFDAPGRADGAAASGCRGSLRVGRLTAGDASAGQGRRVRSFSRC